MHATYILYEMYIYYTQGSCTLHIIPIIMMHDGMENTVYENKAVLLFLYSTFQHFQPSSHRHSHIMPCHICFTTCTVAQVEGKNNGNICVCDYVGEKTAACR